MNGLVVGAGVLRGVYSGGGTERPHWFRVSPYAAQTRFAR